MSMKYRLWGHCSEYFLVTLFSKCLFCHCSHICCVCCVVCCLPLLSSTPPSQRVLEEAKAKVAELNQARRLTALGPEDGDGSGGEGKAGERERSSNNGRPAPQPRARQTLCDAPLACSLPACRLNLLLTSRLNAGSFFYYTYSLSCSVVCLACLLAVQPPDPSHTIFALSLRLLLLSPRSHMCLQARARSARRVVQPQQQQLTRTFTSTTAHPLSACQRRMSRSVSWY